MVGSQLFATSWLGLGFAETPIRDNCKNMNKMR